LVLQICTDSLQVLSGSYSEKFPPSSDGTQDIDNIKFEVEMNVKTVKVIECRLMHKVLEGLRVNKTRTTPLYPVRCDGGALCEDHRGALEKGGLYTPMGLG